MKVSKLISMDSNLAELLALEKNASALINQLLTNYYETSGNNLEKKIKDLKEEQKRIKKSMKEVKKKYEEEQKRKERYAKLRERYGQSTSTRRVEWLAE